MSSLRLHAKIPATRALGPFMRFALWVQGCRLRCLGCMTPDAQPLDGGTDYDTEVLVDEILAQPNIEGLTVSGGEPFLQAQALAHLVFRLRQQKHLGLIVYTGFDLAGLQNIAQQDQDVKHLLSQIDLLIDGPYIAACNHGGALIGSANQRIIPLTKRYVSHVPLYQADQPRQVELHVTHGERMLVGIPSAGQLAWWQAYKKF